MPSMLIINTIIRIYVVSSTQTLVVVGFTTEISETLMSVG